MSGECDICGTMGCVETNHDKKVNDGGPAFPSINETYHDSGMTLRDYFAAKAIQAFNINPDWDGKGWGDMAEAAYQQADAMIAAREGK